MGGGAWQEIVAGGWQSQGFGCTAYSFEWLRGDCPGGHFHAGIDIACAFKTPVHSTRGGLVAAVGLPYLGPFAVCVHTDDGVYLEFGHLEAAAVAVGQPVEAGSLIGLAGTRGASTGVHVHLEARSDGALQGPPWAAVLDPTPFLLAPTPKPQGEAMICYLPDGSIHAVALGLPDADGHHHVFHVVGPGGSLAAPQVLDTGALSITEPSITATPDGHALLSCIGLDGQMYTMLSDGAGNPLQGWTPIGGGGVFAAPGTAGGGGGASATHSHNSSVSVGPPTG